MAQTKVTNKKGNYIHGLSRSPEYSVWLNMKNRCSNPNCLKYNIYGGRGIRVCQEWVDSFESFYKDMGARPGKKYTLDRIDTNKGYAKENCRWVTNKVNCRNKRNNLLIEGKTLSQWSEELGINRSTLAQRLYVYKWPTERVLSN